MLRLSSYALDAETPLDLLTDYLTPTDLFFVRHHWNPASVDLRDWTLVVDGEVANPQRLTLADLRRMPQSSATCVLQCAGNGRALFDPAIPGVQWKYGAVANARWSGVRVKHVLDRARIRASAKHLHTLGSDVPPRKVPPFARSIELDKVIEDGIIALDMNGEPLSHLHGAPARLIVPGWAGDHWMKWLRQLRAAPASQTGFFMETAYRYPKQPGAAGVVFPPDQMGFVRELFVKSSITTAPARTTRGVPVTIKGFAFSGAPDIANVEISDDGGATWKVAELDAEHDPYAWRLWSCRWTPQRKGTVTIAVRATDSRGSVQPRDAVWNQSGYLHNGWHTATIDVTDGVP